MSEGELFVRDLGGTVLLPAWIHQSYGLDQSWALLVALAGRPTAVPLPGFTLCYCLFLFCFSLLLLFLILFFFDPSWVWLGLVFFFFGWSVGWFWKRKQSCLEREGWRRHLGRVRAAGPEHFSAAGEGGRGGQRDSTLLSLHSTSGSLREGISGKLNQLRSLSFTK